MVLAITIMMAVLALAFVLLPIVKPGVNKETLVIISLVAAIPFSAVIGYEIGVSGNASTQSTSAANDAVNASEPSVPDPLKMVSQLEEKLNSGSGTPDQWAMLARSYVTLNRHKDAASAYAQATATITDDAQLYADYADALAMSKGGLDKEAEALIDKALNVDPSNPKALSLKATIAFNNKDYLSAIDLWEKLLSVPGLNQDWVAVTRGSIEEARGLMRQGNKK